MMLPFGPFELIIIAVIIMIFFGAGKLGDLGGALKRSISEFKNNAGWGDSDKPDETKPAKR
jgi:sec-independent protein translocase protein TatA